MVCAEPDTSRVGLFWDQGAKTAGVPVAHVQKLAVAQRSQLQLDPHSQWEHAPHAAEGTQKPVLPNCNCIP